MQENVLYFLFNILSSLCFKPSFIEYSEDIMLKCASFTSPEPE